MHMETAGIIADFSWDDETIATFESDAVRDCVGKEDFKTIDIFKIKLPRTHRDETSGEKWCVRENQSWRHHESDAPLICRSQCYE